MLSNNFRGSTLSELDVARRLVPVELFTGCNVVLFEDDRTARELFPLAVMRPSWEIRCGAGCLRRWLSSFDKTSLNLLFRPRPQLHGRAFELAGREDDLFDPEADTLFLNGRLIALWKSDPAAQTLPTSYADADGRVLWARVRGSQAQKLLAVGGNDFNASLVQEIRSGAFLEGWELRYARYTWDYHGA